MNHAWLLLFCALVLFPTGGLSAEPSSQPSFFLPQNPVAAAYVIARLSNRELIEAPRSEFIYVALLARKGLDKKYRLEALDGLAVLRHTDRLTELLRGLAELDKKGAESDEALRELAPILLQTSRSAMIAKREQLQALTQQGQLPVTRQAAFAALVTADAAVEPTWSHAEVNPDQLADLIRGIPFIPDAALREKFYSKVKPLLSTQALPALRQATIAGIVAIPAHESATFVSLADLVEAGIDSSLAIGSLTQIPRAAWPKDNLATLAEHLLRYLQAIPTEQRAEAPFATAIQFATDVAALLPPETEQALNRALRKLGPTIITLRAVYEQMRFDKERFVVQAGKPLVITLQNDDAMPHNLAVLTPGSLQEIGQAAEKMPPEPDSEGRLYVPTSPKVLYATKLVNPGQKVQLAFDAPVESADYPFVCTFPGHWLRMAGTIIVVPDVDAYLASHPQSQQPTLTEWKLTDFSSDLLEAAAGRNIEVGRELFTKLACIQCHKLGALGYAYGPELTDVFKRYKNERAAVLQQILEPSKIIEDRYRNFTLEIKGSESLLGIILKEDDQSVTIQTGPADTLIQSVKKSEIEKRHLQASSPMPVGLLNALSKNEILDLLAFLESGGNVPSHQHQHQH
jgi:putative heme-binding domain-containing protein